MRQLKAEASDSSLEWVKSVGRRFPNRELRLGARATARRVEEGVALERAVLDELDAQGTSHGGVVAVGANYELGFEGRAQRDRVVAATAREAGF